MAVTAFVVTVSMKSVLVLAVNKKQCESYVKLRFGSHMFYVINEASEHQVNYLKKNSQVYSACLTGGKKDE